MNKDYTYCGGFSYVGPHGLCKNCRRYIHEGQEPKEASYRQMAGKLTMPKYPKISQIAITASITS